MIHRKFRDIDPTGNLTCGLEYCAAGLVIADYLQPNGEGNPSGKDYDVEYIDPWGDYCQEWRSIDEVVVDEISMLNAAMLSDRYEKHRTPVL